MFRLIFKIAFDWSEFVFLVFRVRLHFVAGLLEIKTSLLQSAFLICSAAICFLEWLPACWSIFFSLLLRLITFLNALNFKSVVVLIIPFVAPKFRRRKSYRCGIAVNHDQGWILEGTSLIKLKLYLSLNIREILVCELKKSSRGEDCQMSSLF